MTYIDWDDVSKKLMPGHKRYPWHLDWINTQFKGIKDIHTTSNVLTDELDIKSDFNSAVAMLRKRVNDIFDPYHRNIFFEQQNFNDANSRGFNVEVPTYLQYGDVEDRISAVLNYYIHFDQDFTYNYYAASPSTTAASVYIDLLVAPVPSDTEIWSIINFYNKIRGHGMWSGLRRIQLVSPTTIDNAKIRFVGGSQWYTSGVVDFDRFGVSSGGGVMKTNFMAINEEIDLLNSATLGYISKIGVGVEMADWGRGGSGYNTTFGVKYNSSGETVATQGSLTDTVNGGTDNGAGCYLQFTVGGKLRIKKDHEYITPEFTITDQTITTDTENACGQNKPADTRKSTNKLATWIRYAGALSLSQQTALINAVIEYNNLNSR